MTSRLRRALATLQRHRELVLPCLVAAILRSSRRPAPRVAPRPRARAQPRRGGGAPGGGPARGGPAGGERVPDAAAGDDALPAGAERVLHPARARRGTRRARSSRPSASSWSAVTTSSARWSSRSSTLVQFLVVAKGAERVAEVAARFTLDAMPGKQMSIDADLRAGRHRPGRGARAPARAWSAKSQMFGAMDGAMKFVKGDVIAGLVIVLVNCWAGCSSACCRTA